LTEANLRICRRSSSKERCRFRNTTANEKYDEIQRLISAIQKEIDSVADSADNSKRSEKQDLGNEGSPKASAGEKDSLKPSVGKKDRGDTQDQTSYSSGKYKYGRRSLRSNRHSVDLDHDTGMEQRSSHERAHVALAIGSAFAVATFMLQLIQYVKRLNK